MTKQARKLKVLPKWKCPHCGGTDVQVSYGAWFTETTDCELTFVETADGDVEYWFCESCDESDSGEPDRNGDV